MDEGVKVSIIVPVYNVAPYIGRCIESLRAQTLPDLEFIFVDDCSTDGSMEAVEAWAAEDARVRALYNEENLGAGPSRNRGIEAACGKYLSFVDPDDWVGDDFYELLYKTAMRTDCDISKGVRVQINDQTGLETSEIAMNNQIVREMKRGKPLYLHFKYGHQAAIYRKELFENPVVRYGTSRNGQDMTFLLAVCTDAKSIAFDNHARYYYLCGREGSATAKYTYNRSMCDLDALEQRIDYLLTMECSDYWLEYLAVPFCVYPSRMYLAQKSDGPCPEAEALFVRRISEQLYRLPGYQRLTDELPELDVLVKYGVIIPSCRYGSGVSAHDWLERWVAFLEERPIPEKPYIMACSIAATDCLLGGLRGRDGSLSYVKQQLGRLRSGCRKQVALVIPRCFVSKLHRRTKKVLSCRL